jgi:hypothetical protein
MPFPVWSPASPPGNFSSTLTTSTAIRGPLLVLADLHSLRIYTSRVPSIPKALPAMLKRSLLSIALLLLPLQTEARYNPKYVGNTMSEVYQAPLTLRTNESVLREDSLLSTCSRTFS